MRQNNIDKIVSESVNRLLNEAMFEAKKDSKKSKKFDNSKNQETNPSKMNNYAKTAYNAKKNGNTVQPGDQEALAAILRNEAVNVKLIADVAGADSSELEKIAHGKTWGNGGKAKFREKGDLGIDKIRHALEKVYGSLYREIKRVGKKRNKRA